MFSKSNLIGLDFETYGATDLFKHGLYRYTECPTFRPLIGELSWCVNDSGTSSTSYVFQSLDFINDPVTSTGVLKHRIENKYIVAHNAPFERRVLEVLGIDLPADRFIDSAVVARAAGAGARLEAAAPQLLGHDKLEEGKRLIQLFSVPSKERQEQGLLDFDPQLIVDNRVDWALFRKYCRLDSQLGLRLVLEWGLQNGLYTSTEHEYSAITLEMNRTGWHVDTDSVKEMQRRYLENQEAALEEFRVSCNAPDLNLNSLKQLKEWCKARGITASSFDEKHVARLLKRITDKLDTMVNDANDPKYYGYWQVARLLKTKQILGGSSLKKLPVILDTVGADGRLRDQYIHIGAGQSYRTTGRSVQMQNLKRLDADNIGDMGTLMDDDCEWSNEELALNTRQVFTASHPQGALIIGDLKSVEARGLAWLAGEQPKLEGFRRGLDIYKVTAATMYHVQYDDVTKAQRQTGKVGELSCGYGAGGGAVQAFAQNMGVEMTEAEAAGLVHDWRQANPAIVKLWAELDEMLKQWSARNQPGRFNGHTSHITVAGDYTVILTSIATPDSLAKQHPGCQSMELVMYANNSSGSNQSIVRRTFHGMYERGNQLCYYKPSDRKTGELWKNHFIDPKTKMVKFYSIYGGKLAGILTQSFCRELFFESLAKVNKYLALHPNIQLVGQFHDEIVLDWAPGQAPQLWLDETKTLLLQYMRTSDIAPTFPLDADVKHDYRYTK